MQSSLARTRHLSAKTGSGDVDIKAGANASFNVVSDEGCGDLSVHYADAVLRKQGRKVVGAKRATAIPDPRRDRQRDCKVPGRRGRGKSGSESLTPPPLPALPTPPPPPRGEGKRQKETTTPGFCFSPSSPQKGGWRAGEGGPGR